MMSQKVVCINIYRKDWAYRLEQILIQKCQFTSSKEKPKAFSFKGVKHYYWEICAGCKNKKEIPSNNRQDMFVPEKCVPKIT